MQPAFWSSSSSAISVANMIPEKYLQTSHDQHTNSSYINERTASPSAHDNGVIATHACRLEERLTVYEVIANMIGQMIVCGDVLSHPERQTGRLGKVHHVRRRGNGENLLVGVHTRRSRAYSSETRSIRPPDRGKRASPRSRTTATAAAPPAQAAQAAPVNRSALSSASISCSTHSPVSRTLYMFVHP